MAMFLRSIYLIIAVRAVVANPANLERRQTGGCSPLELIIARGTTEPGPYGIVVGDPLLSATQLLLPNATGYAVNYPATFDCDSRDIGVNDTLQHLELAAFTCPQQEYVLVGYSQGADVMHFVSPSIPTFLYPRIVALVMFGDPGNRGPNTTFPIGYIAVTPTFPDALAQKLKENCAVGDPVCTNNGTTVEAHLSYHNDGTTYINDSALYIQEQFESGGTSGPSPGTPPGVGDNGAAVASLGVQLGATALCTLTGPTSTSAAASTAPATGAVDPPASVLISSTASVTTTPLSMAKTPASSTSIVATASASNASHMKDTSGLLAVARMMMEARRYRR